MKKYIIISAVCMGLMTACADKLIEENHSDITQKFLTTPDGFRAGLNAVYSIVRDIYSDGGGENGLWALMVTGTDEMQCHQSTSGSQDVFRTGLYDPVNFTPGLTAVDNLWRRSYVAINTLNNLIESAKKMEPSEKMSADELKQFTGEAKFFRGFLYFQLVQQFGDVTLNTTFNEEPSTSATRTDMLLVYDQIIKDLEEASTECSPSPQQNGLASGRISAAAARHVLAKAYLTLAWAYDLTDWYYGKQYHNDTKAQEYFQKALTAADNLITDAPSLGLKLMDNYADLFKEENDPPSLNNKEALMVIRMDWDDDNSFGQQNSQNRYFINGYTRYFTGGAYGNGKSIEDGGSNYSRAHPTRYTLDCFSTLNPHHEFDSRYEGSFHTVMYANGRGPKISTPSTKIGTSTVKYKINGQDCLFDFGGGTWNNGATDTAVWFPVDCLSADQINARIEASAAGGGNKYFIFTPDGYEGVAFFPTLNKFIDRTFTGITDPMKALDAQSDRSYQIYRLAETYLLAAEAAFKLNRPDDAALYINAVRERANRGASGAMNISASDISLNFILEERTRELLAENCRWADLTRTGTLIDRVKLYDRYNTEQNAAGPSGRGGKGKAAENLEGREIKFRLRPIPRTQIESVTTGDPYPQNEGWE